MHLCCSCLYNRNKQPSPVCCMLFTIPLLGTYSTIYSSFHFTCLVVVSNIQFNLTPASSQHATFHVAQVNRSTHVCVIAIPNHMTGAEFCQFTGAFLQDVKEMRFVRWPFHHSFVLQTYNICDIWNVDVGFFHYSNSPLTSSLYISYFTEMTDQVTDIVLL